MSQENKPDYSYDFQKIPAPNSNLSLISHVQETKKRLEQKIKKSSISKHNNLAWFVVFVLMLSLVGLGTYTLTEIQRNKESLLSLKQNQVAGVQDEQRPLSPVSGYGFSLLLESPAPKGYELKKETKSSTYFPSRQATLSKYNIETVESGKRLVSGVEIEVVEYDNKYSTKEFSEIVLKKLEEKGLKYENKGDVVNLPKEIRLNKLQPADPNQPDVYVTTTSENYYVISSFGDHRADSKFAEINRFNDNLLQFLYLN